MDDLSPIARRYVVLASESNEIGTPVENYQTLKQFGLRLRQLSESESSARTSLTLPKTTAIHHTQSRTLSVLCSFLVEAADALYDFVRDSVGEVMDLAASLMEFMKYNTDYNVDSRKFVVDMQAAIDRNPKLGKFRFMKTAIQSKVRSLVDGFPAPDIHRVTRDAFFRTHFVLEEGQLYSAPSVFDNILSFYLGKSDLKEMIEPTILGILEGSIEGTLVTIASLAEMLCSILTPRSSQSLTLVCYCSLTRFLFDEAYTRDREVSQFVEDDGTFLMKCDVISDCTVRSLRFSQGFKGRYGSKMRVSSLFREKQMSSIAKLGQLTNPIDISVVLQRAYALLLKFFGDSQASVQPADAGMLLLCLVAVNPPSNAVSMARFLKKWTALNLVPAALPAREAFIDAVDQIASMEKPDDDEE
jgi:hypothetical protein